MNDYPGMFSVYKKNKIPSRGNLMCVPWHFDYIHYMNKS
jgi:hypothetical protein